MSFFDLIIRNAAIVDGFSTSRYQADVAITGDKIEAVERNLSEASAKKEIDAKGLILSPGFIDIHGHSEYSLLVDPMAQSKVQQGITTEICGNCGFSAAPLLGLALEEGKKHLLAEYGITPKWQSFGEFLNCLEEKPLTINVGSLVGHGMIRGSVIGYQNRPPVSTEFEQMKQLLEEALDEGAFGCSSGLIYVPSSFADLDELVSLMKVAAKKGGVYTTHIRGEGETVFKAVEEALEIGLRAEVPVQISHLKVGKVHWGKASQLLELFDKFIKNGVDATADQYPYTASCTSLSAVLPLWAREGTDDEMKRRLKTPKERNLAIEEVNVSIERNYKDILLSYIPAGPFKERETRKLSELVTETKISAGELVVDMVSQFAGEASAIYFSMQEEDVVVIMKSPLIFIATDAEARPLTGKLADGAPHPRTYGTYPRVLRKYVREKKLLSLEEAVCKMTSLPAAKFGLRGRGIIKEGARADLVLFEADKIADRATYSAPKSFPLGIHSVWVNGEAVVLQGKLTGKTPGVVLRRGES